MLKPMSCYNKRSADDLGNLLVSQFTEMKNDFLDEVKRKMSHSDFTSYLMTYTLKDQKVKKRNRKKEQKKTGASCSFLGNLRVTFNDFLLIPDNCFTGHTDRSKYKLHKDVDRR